MANYLAELTLLDYDFLRFIPSMIAASAVFLAKWTLNPSVHPWVRILSLSFICSLLKCLRLESHYTYRLLQNKTLEHYTWFKASDLKDTVSVLHFLQNNIQKSPLPAIYGKYQNLKVFFFT